MQEHLAERCPLCGCEHEPELHAFVRRSYRQGGWENDERQWIRVVRVVCRTNKRRRKEGGEQLQYTLTILPGFLIPYSTVGVDEAHAAVESYIGERRVNQVGAAMLMGCVDPASFRLFYRRVGQRIQGWVGVLAQVVLALGGQITEEARAEGREMLEAQWVWYELLVRQWLGILGRLPDMHPILHPMRWWYVYAWLAGARTGLGP